MNKSEPNGLIKTWHFGSDFTSLLYMQIYTYITHKKDIFYHTMISENILQGNAEFTKRNKLFIFISFASAVSQTLAASPSAATLKITHFDKIVGYCHC